MRNITTFIITVLCVSAALWGIFYLIFPEPTTLMTWNIVTGILATILLSLNLALNTSEKSLTVKNASSTIVLNTVGINLFIWTIVFTFALGKFDDAQRSLNTLYIGYLIILIVGGVCFAVTHTGASVAEEKNKEVQTVLTCKQSVISQLNALKLQMAEVDTDARSDSHKALSNCIDVMRSVPANALSGNSIIAQQLVCGIEALTDAIISSNQVGIQQSIKKITFAINSLK